MYFQCISCGCDTTNGNEERELCNICLIEEISLKQQYRAFCKKFNFNPLSGEKFLNSTTTKKRIGEVTSTT